jgi:hypothetical protein
MQLRRRCASVALAAWVVATAGARGAYADEKSEQAGPPEAPPLRVPPTPPALAPAEPAPLEAPPKTRAIDAHVSIDAAGYADSDHVFVLTPSVAGRVENPTAGWSVDGSYLVDVVSAASVDIVSTASKNYTEVRQAGTLGGTYKPHDLGGSVNGSISREPDYLSLSGGGSVTQDLYDKNVTLFLGFNHTYDLAGRTSTPFSVFSRTLNVEAPKAGVTLVLDRRTIGSFVVDTIFENGDPSKPYRYVPLFAPGTSVPNGAPVSLVNSLRVSERPLEQLPLSRQRYAASFRLAHRLLNKSTLRLDERLYGDSWLLLASTTDARQLWDLGRRWEVGPHLRLHVQDGASFWKRAYTIGPNFEIPAIRTGDRELGPLLGATLGFSIRLKLGPAANRTAWMLGWDVNVTETRYLDDIYITDRVSTVTGLSLEADL